MAMAFEHQISCDMEADFDDVLVKSTEADRQTAKPKEAFGEFAALLDEKSSPTRSEEVGR